MDVPPSDPGDSVERLLDSDLRALGAMTDHALPSMSETERALRSGRPRPFTLGEHIMKTIQRFSRRPRALAGLAAAGAVSALLLLPVSYERTVGHTAQLVLGGPGLPRDGAQLRPLLRELRGALHGDGVMVTASDQGVTVTLQVPGRSRGAVQGALDALLARWATRQISARVRLVPRTEQVAGRVYAMALERVVQIRVDLAGKSETQIAGEIRDQLEQQGIHDPSVQVARDGDATQVEINAQTPEGEVRLLGRRQGGAQRLELRFGDLDTRREPGMSDEALRDKIERQLRAQGLEPEVTVRGDQVEVRAHRAAEGP